MTSPAQCCTVEGSLAQAAEEMWDYEIHTMPVVDEQGLPVGSLTDRCVCMAALRSNRPLSSLQVRAAMLVGVFCVHQELPVAQLEGLMRAREVRWLPVVGDDGRVVGVVTASDVDRALRKLGERTMRKTRASSYGISTAPMSGGAPRSAPQ